MSSTNTHPEAGISYTTPTKKAVFTSSAQAGPSRPRPSGASPAYSSRRHSLLGSRIWKVGFSGEPEPRAVFLSQDPHDKHSASEAWDLDMESVHGIHGSRSEGGRLIGVRILQKLRETFIKHLLADSKQRKVIIAENTFLPTYIKEHIAHALFDNLRVPSVAFTPSSLLALAACGRITGLVVDVGWLETTITPVYNSRPLFPLSRSTPLAGRRLHTRLRSLLFHHAIYISPPKSLSDLSREKRRGVPLDLLTDTLVERVITEGLLVGGVLNEPGGDADVEMEVEFNDYTQDNVPRGKRKLEDSRLIDSLRLCFASTSASKDMTFPVHTVKGSIQMGHDTIIVPGWIRERAAEVLFQDDEEDEGESIVNALLNTILKLPVDLRPSLISSILITGGSASLPGFIPRLRVSLLRSLLAPPQPFDDTPVPPSPLNTPASRKEQASLWKRRTQEPYRELYGLVDKVGILNDPAPVDGEVDGGNGGNAPRWVPGLMTWVGGSLAGVLRTGGPELTRETYDTLLATSLARGDAYRQELEDAYHDVAASIGINVEELKTGEAVRDGRGLGRRRGWKDGRDVVGDWSRAVKAG
ncbi:hypothetical protein I305_02804 [Cryptococcus gattii E566]|uniref:Actin-like ATPase domain-containing protein n=2 Tax=Cryptococcus gattii TaxID=37769 RepID=E6R6L9_CRYGW|nr:uncharacterized protein CGB_E1440W [Cryptococcus gattii WM276]ADV22349.1 hypothetical protein CNE01210 [Cryptococcus gattii WM276]KIR78664.1 hypothetical protein I306_04360 [Cryptococcus gattii EJB2]KIY34615.1 hypothetical protein I305_02804 [Cryptococcus gattii E566]